MQRPGLPEQIILIDRHAQLCEAWAESFAAHDHVESAPTDRSPVPSVC